MDDDQQFCLRWNNHQSTLVAVFDTLLENGTLVDCTLAAEGKYLNAHKVVLSACSPYFESLLSQNYDKHPIFILKDVKFQELKAMMDYMYRGEVNISQDQLGALLKAAESLQIKGLSDNKKDSEPRKAAPPPVAKSPPPTTSLPRVQGLTIEQRRANRSIDDRDGSQSPGPRKRKRMRPRSTDDLDNHDASNSSESHSNPSIQNIPIALPPPASSKMLTEVPEPVETKSEILRHKEPEIAQVPIIKEKIETHTELMLEPKAEYVEEMNEDSIEDLTLDDDDVSNLDMSNDGAGPSHGNMGDGSGQGFAGWHMGNQNQDEVFLAAQEAVGAHRDNQDSLKKALRVKKFLLDNTDTSEFENVSCAGPERIQKPNKAHRDDDSCGSSFSTDNESNTDDEDLPSVQGDKQTVNISKLNNIIQENISFQENHLTNQLQSSAVKPHEPIIDVLVQGPKVLATKQDCVELKDLMLTQNRKLDSVLELLRSMQFNIRSAYDGDNVFDDPSIPLKSITDIIKFDENLRSDNDISVRFKNFLMGLGGDSVRTIIKYIVQQMYDLNVQTKINWTGRENKHPMCDLKQTNIIVEVMHIRGKKPLPECIDEYKYHLQHASDRVRTAAKREKKIKIIF